MSLEEISRLPCAVSFGREVCGDPTVAEQREWLVTNGLGGYASGTLPGVLTRRYHGLLVAALQPPLGRTLLLTKLDETAHYAGLAYPLFSNRWEDGRREPEGWRHLESFRLEGTTPVWSFACADALLEKRIWMEPGTNTTYVRYDLVRAAASLRLSAKAIVDGRDHHGSTRASDWEPDVQALTHGLVVRAGEEARRLYLLSGQFAAILQLEWYRGYWLSWEAYRGLDALDDHVFAGLFDVVLAPGESATMVASVEPGPDLDGEAAYARRVAHEVALLRQAGVEDRDPVDGMGATEPQPGVELQGGAPVRIRHLALAADQFMVRRSTGTERAGHSVIAGYPWFGDWGRDTMIALPGLALVTGRIEVAASILRTFATFVSRGMLPNRFPDEGQVPEYNTVDATLWYFEAIRAYLAATDGDALVRDLFPVLQEIVDWHMRGTRYQIHVDPADGLLYAGEPGVQLTWMDAKVDDWVVTPRIGKPVEVNALWYNAQCIVAGFAQLMGKPSERYEALAKQSRVGFARFWNEETGYCFDVLDGPEGNDPALRPNQLLAVSLPHSPLPPEQQKAVVDACARHLLTSHGMRSLDPRHPEYKGRHGGERQIRDAAYHQGTAWGWLIGPFVTAHMQVYRDPALARSFLRPLVRQLDSHCVGSLSEICDGDPPFTPRGCFAQAWTVAEVLRAWKETVASRVD